MGWTLLISACVMVAVPPFLENSLFLLSLPCSFPMALFFECNFLCCASGCYYYHGCPITVRQRLFCSWKLSSFREAAFVLYYTNPFLDAI